MREERGVGLIDRGTPRREELSRRDVDHVRGEERPGGVGEKVRVGGGEPGDGGGMEAPLELRDFSLRGWGKALSKTAPSPPPSSLPPS